MREILFRGKWTNNGEWVEGYFGESRKKDICYIIKRAGGDSCSEYFIDFEVSPETVGQFTGLTGKNGTKIFEGDIVKTEIYNGKRYEKIVGVITYIKEHMAFAVYQIHERMCDIIDELHHKLEIIGNIHDNPELLESEGK